MNANTDSPPPIDSAETARRRIRYRWAKGIIWANGAIFVVAASMGQLLDWMGRDDLINDTQVVWIVLATIPLFLFNFYILRRYKRLLELAERRDRATAGRSDQLAMRPVEPLIYSTTAKDSPETARLRAQHSKGSPVGLVALAIAIVAWVLVLRDVALRVTVPAALIFFGIAIVITVRNLWRDRKQTAVSEAEQRDRAAQHAADVAEARRHTLGPVLYLRSFTDDDRAGARHGALTEEEHLARALAWVGPLVAVGRPGEQVTQVGAQRVYLKDDAWQSRVMELMKDAALVVLRTGSTQGFHWEVTRALVMLSPEKLLLVVDNHRELRGVLEAIANHLGQPRAKVRCRGKSIGSVKGLVMFEEGWAPRSLRLRRGTMRSLGEDGTLAGRFVLSLRPLFDRRGVVYQVPPISAAKAFWLGFPVFWGILIAVADYFDR